MKGLLQTGICRQYMVGISETFWPYIAELLNFAKAPFKCQNSIINNHKRVR